MEEMLRDMLTHDDRIREIKESTSMQTVPCKKCGRATWVRGVEFGLRTYRYYVQCDECGNATKEHETRSAAVSEWNAMNADNPPTGE